MKKLGYQICEDGKTEWRNNGGIIERRALYAGNTNWETVAVNSDFNLKKFCKAGGYKFLKSSPGPCRIVGI